MSDYIFKAGDSPSKLDKREYYPLDDFKLSCGYHSIEEYQATHWMPLPEKPTI